jgi:hypothetical protein
LRRKHKNMRSYALESVLRLAGFTSARMVNMSKDRELWAKQQSHTPSPRQGSGATHFKMNTKANSGTESLRNINFQGSELESPKPLIRETAAPTRVSKNNFSHTRRFERHDMRMRACTKYARVIGVIVLPVLMPALFVSIATTPASAYKHQSAMQASMIKYVATCWTARCKPTKTEILVAKMPKHQ